MRLLRVSSFGFGICFVNLTPSSRIFVSNYFFMKIFLVFFGVFVAWLPSGPVFTIGYWVRGFYLLLLTRGYPIEVMFLLNLAF